MYHELLCINIDINTTFNRFFVLLEYLLALYFKYKSDGS
jgi:hypothetical protein